MLGCNPLGSPNYHKSPGSGFEGVYLVTFHFDLSISKFQFKYFSVATQIKFRLFSKKNLLDEWGGSQRMKGRTTGTRAALRALVLELRLEVTWTLSPTSIGKFSTCCRESGCWNMQTYINSALEDGS